MVFAILSARMAVDKTSFLSHKCFNRCLQEGNVNHHYDNYQSNRKRSYSLHRNLLQALGPIAKAVILERASGAPGMSPSAPDYADAPGRQQLLWDSFS
jgi:hypothetical protein